MADFHDEISRSAGNAVAMCQSRSGGGLDFSEASLTVVEDMLAEAAAWANDMTQGQIRTLTQDFGCYILEVAHRTFGGKFYWFDERDQPVLVVGEPEFRVSLMTWDKVRGRLPGDEGDNIPFFYTGFAERARRAEPGTDALYV